MRKARRCDGHVVGGMLTGKCTLDRPTMVNVRRVHGGFSVADLSAHSRAHVAFGGREVRDVELGNENWSGRELDTLNPAV